MHKKLRLEVVVKLHSDLRTLTQLQLVGVGVDFVFPLEEEPTPSFCQKEWPNTCEIWWLSYGCLEDAWWMSDQKYFRTKFFF